MFRGIKQETFDLAHVRDREGGKKFFPIYNAYGKFVGSVTHQPKSEMKYYFNLGNDFTCFGHWMLPKLFYGKPVVVVEGVYDSLTLIQEGISAIAIVGSELSKKKLKEIYRYTNHLIFCPDSDTTGERALKRMLDKIENMKGYEWKTSICRQSLYKDVNELLMEDPRGFQTFLGDLREHLI